MQRRVHVRVRSPRAWSLTTSSWSTSAPIRWYETSGACCCRCVVCGALRHCRCQMRAAARAITRVGWRQGAPFPLLAGGRGCQRAGKRASDKGGCRCPAPCLCLRASAARLRGGNSLCLTCLPPCARQYLEELEAFEAAQGAAALPGKRPLLSAEAAAQGVGELGRGALRPLVRRTCPGDAGQGTHARTMRALCWPTGRDLCTGASLVCAHRPCRVCFPPRLRTYPQSSNNVMPWLAPPPRPCAAL